MKNRLFFILWLAVLALLWLPGRLQSAGVILTDSLLAVIVLAIWTYFATKHIKAGFELKGSRNGERQAVLEIKTNYSGKLPIGLKLKIQSENLLTGQMCEMALRLHAEKKDKWTLEFKSNHAGKLQVMIEAVYVTDLLGLFCFRLKGVERQMLTCLLLPQAAEPPQMPEVFYQYAESSDTYAENRPGADQSQTYELRDYRSGDNFRAIHWKLSSRNESWIVREGKDMFNIQANAVEISQGILGELNTEMQKIGLAATSFQIDSVSYPEEVQKMVTKVASQSMVGDMGRYQQMAMIDAMTNTSNNGGGNNMATDMASMQMGMMMGQQMVNQMQSAMQQNNQNMQGQVQNSAPAPQNQAAGQASGTIPNFCPNCGQKTEGSKFCPNCGQKLVD